LLSRLQRFFYFFTVKVKIITASCDFFPDETSSESDSSNEASTEISSTPTSEPTSTTEPTPTSGADPTIEPTATPEITSEGETGPINTAAMYSSYAYMVSYDPARGWADFDYFNLLQGDDAVQYLVDHEGYTLEDAQALVDDFADSEFICQNDNPQLRTVDLQEVDLKLMYYPDGTMVTDATSLDSELIDLYDLYHVDPDLVLDSFFYYITVVDDDPVAVEQVYWP
jgi:hypothetical protein